MSQTTEQRRLEALIGKWKTRDGAAAYEASLNEDGDTLEWAMSSEKDRFAGTFSPDRNSINGHWESRTADGSWQPWMDITLDKQAN